MTGTFTLWETSLQEHVPDRALSRVSSYDYLSSAGMIPLGNLVTGVLGHRQDQARAHGHETLVVCAALWCSPRPPYAPCRVRPAG